VINLIYKIAKLIKASTTEISINEAVDFADAVNQHFDIKKLSKILVTGKGLLKPTSRTMEFELTITGEMTLSCALTLDEVAYPFATTINPTFTWNAEQHDPYSEDYLIKDTVELAPLIWQEILIQVPQRVVKDGAHAELKRLGIELLSEENHQLEAKNTIDSRFLVLEKLEFEK